MIIHNISLNNRFIDYRNVSIDLCTPGIYLILGANGTGKSTLLNSLVYDDLDAQFDDPKMEWCYHHERYRLISYVHQNVEDCDMSVYDYIFKDNPNVDYESAKSLLSELDFDLENCDARVQSLSGGERIKISFVSALLKNTPYLFLDEPTNYLDDSSVENMVDMIKKRATNTVIVIASHDSRITNIGMVRYILDGKNICREIVNCNSDDRQIPVVEDLIKIPFCKIAWKRINRPINYFIWFLIMLVSFGVTLFLQFFFYLEYDDDALPSQNMVAVYSVDCAFDTLNQRYCKGEGLDITDETKYNMVFMSDIPELAKMTGIEEIYILDTPKYMEFSTQLNQQNIQKQLGNAKTGNYEGEMYCFAMPEAIRQDQQYLDLIGMRDFNYLIDGRTPRDNENEVSISVELLQKFYGLTKEEAENSIGRKIVCNNEEYEIVGIQYIDVCILSYSDKLDDCGFYRYDLDSFQQFETYYNDYFEENGFDNKSVDTFFVLTKSGMEKNVLNKLIQQFPSNNYYSYSFAQMWTKEQNVGCVRKYGSIALLVSLVLGICYYLIQRRQILLNAKRLAEYNRYYVNNHRIGKYYCILCFLFCGIIIVLDLLFGILINGMFGMLKYISSINLICIFLLILPSTLCIFKRILFTKQMSR